MNNLTNLNVTSRKLRKPLMERKRRARINRSLDELQDLLTDTDFAAKGTKLEKADILELTVEYVKQTRQRTDSKEERENFENVLTERFLSGFEKCAKEVQPLVEPKLRDKLDKHLRECLERVKTQQHKPGEAPGLCCWGNNPRKPTSCSFLIQKPKDLKILPSKLPNGDVLLLLSSSSSSSSTSSSSDRFGKVWRPWW